jgi:UDP-glucose 4-epimerase
MQRRIPDCTLAGKLVGFAPRRTLDDVIRSVIEDQEASQPLAAASS